MNDEMAYMAVNTLRERVDGLNRRIDELEKEMAKLQADIAVLKGRQFRDHHPQ